jgi:uncharacterized integral membrane protein
MLSAARGLSLRVRAGMLGGVLAVIAFVIFAVQNGNTAAVHFLAWSWPQTPVFAVILCSVVVGFVVGVVFGLLRPRGGQAGDGRALRRGDLEVGSNDEARGIVGPPPEGQG